MDLLVCGCKVTKCDCEWIANGFAKRKPRTTFAVIVRLLMSAGFCIVASGCDGLFVKPSGPVKPVPVVVKDNCWEYLARLVEKDRFTNTDELILTVKSLRESDAISDAEQSAFKAAFAAEQSKQRPIDKASDAAKLRGL